MANNEKDIKSLELRIDKAIKEIQKGEKTPKEAEIGKLLNLLKAMDEASYVKYAEKYRPVSNEYFEKYRQSDEYKSSPEYKKLVEQEKKKKEERRKALEFAETLKGGGGGSFVGDDDDGPPRPKKGAKPAKKEPKVKLPKTPKAQKEKGVRDLTLLKFGGEEYKKGPLVLAVIRKYVKDNPKTNYDLLKKAFPDELLKGYGIFQSYEKAMEISKKVKRFFLHDDQLVRLAGPVKNVAICNQFSSDNILPFLAHARKMGFKID